MLHSSNVSIALTVYSFIFLASIVVIALEKYDEYGNEVISVSLNL